MRGYKRVVLMAIAASTASMLLSAPAQADKNDDPCSLKVTIFCRFLPIAPDLDHDVDLTQEPPPADWTHS
jgi:hypothetical protein